MNILCIQNADNVRMIKCRTESCLNQAKSPSFLTSLELVNIKMHEMLAHSFDIKNASHINLVTHKKFGWGKIEPKFLSF
jgi:hypothetical protein